MMSSFSPRGATSVSMSVTKPYLYSRLAELADVARNAGHRAPSELWQPSACDTAERSGRRRRAVTDRVAAPPRSAAPRGPPRATRRRCPPVIERTFGEAVPGEVRRGVEAALPVVAVEDDRRVLGPAHHHLRHRLGHQRGALDASQLPLRRRPDVDQAGRVVAAAGQRPPPRGSPRDAGRSDVGVLDEGDHLVHIEDVVAAGHLLERVAGLVPAAVAPAHVVAAEQGALGARVGLQDLAASCCAW